MTSPETITKSGLLSDDSNWKDNGCELSAACLSCPLPSCIEEKPRGRQKLRMDARASQMVGLRSQGKSTREIATLFQVSQRTVQRTLATYGATRGTPNE